MSGFVENVNTLANALTLDNIASINTVAASAADIGTVADNIGDVGIVADDIASVKTTASNIGNVNTVGSNIAGVVTLAPVTGDISTLAPQVSNIATVGTNIGSVVTTASNISSVDIVAADIGLAGYSNINDLGAITDPVTATPSTGVSAIKVVSDNITNVNSVATTVVPNMAEILQVNDNTAIVTSIYNEFDNRYLGAKTVAPTTDNDGNPLLVGALYWNTVDNSMYIWTGTTWDGITSSFTANSVATITNKTINSISNFVGADHVHYACRNVSGSTIPAGTVVTASSTQPGTDYIRIVPLTDNQTQVALGVTSAAIANNSTGLTINTGLVTDVVNTSSWAVGTILYVGSTGGFTVTKPSSGVYQACAVVLRSHATQGTMLVEFTEPKSTTAKIVADILSSGVPLDMGGIV